MPRWTKYELQEYQARSAASRAKLEQIVRHEPVAETAGTDRVPHRVTLRITSFRRRLLDPDNLAGGCKHLIDGLRHAGLLFDDRPQDIELVVRQEKVTNKDFERTEIVIEPL